MSTFSELQSNFPYYVNLFLHSNSINDFTNYSLSYSNSEFSISSWNYGIDEPTVLDLQEYTLSEVMEFQEARDKIDMLNSTDIPVDATEDQETAMASLGGIRNGSLLWETDQSKLYVWDGTQWKALAFEV